MKIDKCSFDSRVLDKMWASGLSLYEFPGCVYNHPSIYKYIKRTRLNFIATNFVDSKVHNNGKSMRYLHTSHRRCT